jgi:hypothetical protein
MGVKVVLFRIHLRDDIDAGAYQRAFERMLELVQAVPGFRGIEGFTGEDGSELAVAWFDSDKAIAGTDRQYSWPGGTATRVPGEKVGDTA